MLFSDSQVTAVGHAAILAAIQKYVPALVRAHSLSSPLFLAICMSRGSGSGLSR